MLKLLATILALYGLMLILKKAFPAHAEEIVIRGYGLFVVIFVGFTWWIHKFYTESVSYITDRRIMRFKRVFPCFYSKRYLFWNDQLKTKAIAPNFFIDLLKIGTIVVSPTNFDRDDVKIKHVYYYEDLVFYIDKILYTFNNTPESMGDLRPFVTAPRGKRY